MRKDFLFNNVVYSFVISQTARTTAKLIVRIEKNIVTDYSESNTEEVHNLGKFVKENEMDQIINNWFSNNFMPLLDSNLYTVCVDTISEYQSKIDLQCVYDLG